LAGEKVVQARDEVLEVLQRDLKAAHYAAQRAQKQYDGADPENRLVVDTLERRWEASLQRVKELEHRIAEREQLHVPSRLELSDLAAQLESIWNGSNEDPRWKKRIIQTLIEEILIDSDSESGQIRLVIH
jgi:hypothetical protein